MEKVIPGGRGYTRPPLRTYSKRPTSNSSTEPPSKKRRIDDGITDSVGSAGSLSRRVELPKQPPKQSQPHLPPPAAATSKQPKKGTILSYFKVTSPSSGTASSCEQSSEPAIPLSTPPSPPALNTVQRKRRRLTTKPVRHTRSDISDSSAELGVTETVADTSLKELENSNTVLRQVGTNVANRQIVKRADKSDLGKHGAKRRPKSTQATVQTTLSLSLTEKQFVECNDCNMLYNPYHEKDVKLHARQHAALKRTTRSTIGNE